ncbi:MAG: hypothetical protein HQM02_02250 [Magnetococcales bacterium]|nr:hypothetical protein [Magnetococcales bacterium]
MIHRGNGASNRPVLSQAHTFFVATREDWLAWLSGGELTQAQESVTDKRVGRGVARRGGKGVEARYSS